MVTSLMLARRSSIRRRHRRLGLQPWPRARRPELCIPAWALPDNDMSNLLSPVSPLPAPPLPPPQDIATLRRSTLYAPRPLTVSSRFLPFFEPRSPFVLAPQPLANPRSQSGAIPPTTPHEPKSSHQGSCSPKDLTRAPTPARRNFAVDRSAAGGGMLDQCSFLLGNQAA